jgi:hypothetical protein
MRPLDSWEEIIDGKRFSTKTAVLIARGTDKNTDNPRNWSIFLYRTPEDTYFKVHLNPSENRNNLLHPVTRVEALNLFAELTDRCVDLEDAFSFHENRKTERV